MKIIALGILAIVVLGVLVCFRQDASADNMNAVKTIGNVYYVSPCGSNSNPGTISKPWETIQYAADKLTAGDTVYIRKGTYKERIIPKNSGQSGGYITYAAYGEEKPVIDGAEVQLPNDQAGLFEINDRSYIKVSGLKVMNAKTDDNSSGIFVNKSHDIIIQKNFTYNTRSSGISVWASKNIIIDGNEVVNACNDGEQECITVAGTDTFEVKNNHVHDGGQSSIGGEGIDSKDGSSNGKIYKNLVYNIPDGVGIYVEAWDKHTYNIEVFGNIVHDITNGDGFQAASEMGGLLENIKFYNNIGYNNKFCGLTVARNGTANKHPLRNISIINNTFYHNGIDWGGGIAADNPDAEEIIIRNNICSQNCSFEISISNDMAKQNVVVENNLINDYKSDTDDGEVTGGNYVQGDPLFVNPSMGDFHLRENSPAINKGSANDAPKVDFDGKMRPQDGAYDMGVFEYSETN